MKALIIAAGMGRRLKKLGDSKPLVKLLGLPLIERVIMNAVRAGVDEFVVVVGYKGEQLKEALREIADRRGVKINVVDNPDWKKENGLSVLRAREHFKNGEKFLLLMSDHIHEISILKKLLEFPLKDGEIALAVDRKINGNKYVDHEDATKVLVENGYILDIGKTIENYNAYDTGAFLCTPAIFDAIEKSEKQSDDTTLSGGVRVLAKERKALAVDIGDAFWIDVDDEKAYKKAEDFLLGKLTKSSDGPISRYINRPISHIITKYVTKHSITPNQITLFSFSVAVLASILFLVRGYFAIFLGGILSQLSSILDGVDGEVARIKYLETKFGKWLDTVLDRYADGFLLGGLTLNAFMYRFKNNWSIVIGILAIMGSLINSYIAMKYDELMMRKGARKYFRIGRDVRIFIIFLGAILARPFETLLVIATIMHFENIRRIFVLKANESLL